MIVVVAKIAVALIALWLTFFTVGLFRKYYGSPAYLNKALAFFIILAVIVILLKLGGIL